MKRQGRRALAPAALAAACAIGCAEPPPTAAPSLSTTTASWRAGLARLEALRAATSTRAPRTMRLAITLREPITRRVFRARGAVALAPDELRMILLGPGGATALDLWSRGDRFRFAIPAIGRVVRGDARSPRASMRGIPVDFLRFWLLAPARGRLLWQERTARGDRFVLRDGAAITDLRAADDGALSATRTTFAPAEDGRARRVETERVTASARGCADVTYTQESTGLVVHVACEGEDATANPRAFEDPDGAGR